MDTNFDLLALAIYRCFRIVLIFCSSMQQPIGRKLESGARAFQRRKLRKIHIDSPSREAAQRCHRVAREPCAGVRRRRTIALRLKTPKKNNEGPLRTPLPAAAPARGRRVCCARRVACLAFGARFGAGVVGFRARGRRPSGNRKLQETNAGVVLSNDVERQDGIFTRHPAAGPRPALDDAPRGGAATLDDGTATCRRFDGFGRRRTRWSRRRWRTVARRRVGSSAART